MTDLSNFAKGQIARLLMRGESVALPAQWYVALFVSPTDDDGSGTEVFMLGYVRQPILFGVVNAAGETRNALQVLFPAAGDNWGVITHFALYDAEEDGHMWFHGPLDSQVIIEMGEMFEFVAESIVVSFQ